MDPVAAPAVRIEATVRGRVQGVGYRYFVVMEARRLRLSGWVSNESDGSVRLVAEGSQAAVNELEASLNVGPYGAIVDAVAAVRMAATGSFDGFSVRSGGHRGD